jgi:transcriptional regulator with XRE-family HTH domain
LRNVHYIVLMSTLGGRIKIVQIRSGLQQPQFAKNLGVSKETLIHYQKDRRHPDSEFLSNLCKIFGVNPAWLLIGEGESFVEGSAQEIEITDREKVSATDPVLQLLHEEERQAGITLNPDQHTAILKIFRELVYRDICLIRELLCSIPGEQEKGNE